MATGLRIYNTTVSGSVLNSSLGGDDIRGLNFAAAVVQPPPKTLTAVASAGVGDALTINDWVQASISSLGLNNTSGGTGVSLGPDSATGALFYQGLFGLVSANDRRLLRFYLSATGTTNLYMRNSSATNQYVSVSVNGGAASNSQLLFNAATGAVGTQAGNTAGFERFVLVSGNPIGGSSAAVNFNILSGSL
jgi:hypothetical protein